MTKKTFNIAALFAIRSDDKCLEEVLEETLAEQTLDQQDVIDIVETASVNYRKLHAFYNQHKGAIRPPIGRPYSFDPVGHIGAFGTHQPDYSTFHPQTFKSGDHPAFFETLFHILEFEIRYGNTLLTGNFKFLGVNGTDELLYLGRDKEAVSVKASAVYSHNTFNIRLDAQNTLGHLRINPTFESLNRVVKAIEEGAIVLPGHNVYSTSTRELMGHLRTQAWRQVTEGDLVTLIDRQEAPETVFLLGRIERQDECSGLEPQAVVMPVSVHVNGKEITTVPMGGSIQKVDLMLLKPWVYKG